MEFEKILYVTDVAGTGFREIEQLMVLNKLGFKELLCLVPKQVEGLAEKCKTHGIGCEVSVGKTPSVQEIAERAESGSFSLIACRLQKKAGGLSRGTVIRDLIRISPVPIFVMSKASDENGVEDPLFRHVVYATDWSSASDTSLRYLVNFRELIHELEIVTVINKKLSIRDMMKLKDRIEDTRLALLDLGVDAEAHVYAGEPPDEILLAAKDYQVSTIVVGSSRVSKWKDLFTRNCSHEVAENTIVPTLIVPNVGG